MSTIRIEARLPFEELLRAVEQLSLPDLEQLQQRVTELSAQRQAPRLADSETELISKIKQPLPPLTQKRFDELIVKRQAYTLTDDEYQELLALTHQIELFDAKRVEYLAQLSLLRNIDIMTLMNDLGMKTPSWETSPLYKINSMTS